LTKALLAAAHRRRATWARAVIGQRAAGAASAATTAIQPDPALRLGLDLGLPLGAILSAEAPLSAAMAQAEQLTRTGAFRAAAQAWEDLAGLLGPDAPALLYQRLQQAMTRNTQGWGGSETENHCWGDRPKHEVLAACQRQLEPALYLEIGVDAGISLATARGPAIGLDPRPRLKLVKPPGPHARLLTTSSDAFFRDQAERWLQPRPELAFIDGMHLFEFALRDFRHIERHASPSTLVVIDDIFPGHPAQAERRRRTKAWTGDIWKLHQILRATRPDLTLLALNAHTTGLLLIAGLDPENRVLWHQEPALVTRYRHQPPPPPEALERHGAIPSDHPLVARLLATLRQGRDAGWSVAQVRDALAALQPEIAEAEQACWGQACRLAERAATASASGA
jgi:hypothetical protein